MEQEWMTVSFNQKKQNHKHSGQGGKPYHKDITTKRFDALTGKFFELDPSVQSPAEISGEPSKAVIGKSSHPLSKPNGPDSSGPYLSIRPKKVSSVSPPKSKAQTGPTP